MISYVICPFTLRFFLEFWISSCHFQKANFGDIWSNFVLFSPTHLRKLFYEFTWQAPWSSFPVCDVLFIGKQQKRRTIELIWIDATSLEQTPHEIHMMARAGDVNRWTGWDGKGKKRGPGPMSCGCAFDVFCDFLGCLLRFLMSSSPVSLFIVPEISKYVDFLMFSYVIWNSISFSEFLGYVICPSMFFRGITSIYILGRRPTILPCI